MSDAPAMDLLRVPQNIESEQSVIGGLLIQPDAFDRIDWLPAASFFRADHRIIYAALRSLIEAGKPVDVLMLAQHLKARSELEKAGGQGYLLQLQVNTASAANIHHYAAHVRDAAILRGVQTYAMDLTEAANEVGADPAHVLELADSRLHDVQAGREETTEALPFHRVLDKVLRSSMRPETGLTTGFPDLDRITGRLKGGHLIVIAGRPSMGKSGLAACIAEHTAWTEPAALYSLEMSDESIAKRIFKWHERDGRDRAVAKLASGFHLYIDRPSRLTIGGLRLKLRRQARKHGCALAVIDYLQLMDGTGGENRTQEVGRISRGLKQLAVELDIPIIAVCQINRGVESRPDKRPMLSDLRESGDIEQDADLVLMVYREEYYNPSTPEAGTAQILVRKNRDGHIGNTRLTFIKECARFASYGGPPILDEPPANTRQSRVSNFNDFKSRAAGDDAA